MIKLDDLQKKVVKRISDYAEFDISEMFKKADYVTIFGGAVRDSLANLEIHDIDILCMPESASILRKFLKEKYNYTPLDLYDQDTLNMYKGVSLIAEPWTLMNNNRKIIQIIRPSYSDKGYRQTSYVNAYLNIIKNVDISCCGVFLEGINSQIKLKEACKDAIVSCLTRSFEVNDWSELYKYDRTLFREHKLTQRGWHNCDEYIPDKQLLKIERKKKIFNFEFKPEYDYRVWTEDEYRNRKEKTPKNETSFI